MELANKIYSKLFGKKIGEDEWGNAFYKSNKFSRYFGRNIRWVYYKGTVEPTKIDTLWHSWLHHQVDYIPSNNEKYVWEKSREVNLTGTEFGYYPPGHILSILKNKAKLTRSYYSWQPKKKIN